MSEATRRAVARKTTDITTFPATGHRIERLRWKCRPVPIAALVAALTSLSLESALAQTWTGATSNDWTVGSNWSGGAVPTGVSGVVINKAPGVVLGVNGAATGATNGVILTTDLTIQKGSTLNSAGIAGIASTVGSTSTATVTGAGSVWNVGGQLNAGGTGTGTLNIENGAEVNAHAGVKVGLLATASGTLNINSSGLLQTTSLAGGAGAAHVNFDDATIRALAGSPTFISALTISQLNIAAGGLTVDTNGFSIGAPGFSGAGGLTIAGTGTLTLNSVSTFAGQTVIGSGSTLALATAGSVAASSGVVANGTFDISGITAAGTSIQRLTGGGTVATGTKTLTLTNANDSFAGAFSGSGGLTLAAGSETLIGNSAAFTGTTAVQAGTLVVNGNLGGTMQVSSGATLQGSGSVGATSIASGGTFAPGDGTPGSSMTMSSLSLASGAIYLVQLNSATSAFANVTGSATLGGATVNAVFTNATYISKQYTILKAGSIGGAFGTLTNTDLPANFTDKLSADGKNAYLNLTLNFTAPSSSGSSTPNFGSGLSGNQQAVATALTNSFNTSGGILAVFGTLTPAGLTQASGELATGSQQTTFDAMSQFMGVMTDPLLNRGGGSGGSSPSSGYAEESAYAARPNSTDAFAMFTKAPPAPFEQRWSTWISGFGGSQTTDGNAAGGANNTTSSLYGTAVGADYLFSPNTIAGFAMAGGGTNFSVNASGSGHSDLFQFGAYVRHTEGAAYVSAALAYGWQDITTNRTVTAAGSNLLRAEFNANVWSGRLESGYRFATPWMGITPYAAAQFVTFDLPSYAESVLSGASAFALAYGARDVTDSRSELGIRADKSFLVQDGVLTLRGRLAWAHDYDPDRSVGATFQALPGASFVVNGAAQAADSALTTTSIEMKWRSGWSAAATFDGEFSDVTRSYAGKGVVRYQW